MVFDSYRERRRRRSIRLGGVGLIMVGIFFLLGSVMLAIDHVQTGAIPVLSLGEAKASPGRTVRLSGKLHGSAPLSMPDDGSPVLRGRVHLQLRARRHDTKRPETQSLIDWQEASAGSLSLVAADGELPLAIGIEALPMRDDHRSRPEGIYEGSGRLATLVGYRYAGREWPIDRARWGNADLSIDLDRALLPQDAVVTMLASVDEEGRVVAPYDDELRVWFGNPAAVARGSLFMIVLLPLLGIGLIVVGVKLFGSAGPRADGDDGAGDADYDDDDD